MAERFDEWISALYKKEYRRLCRVAYRLTGNQEIAKELVQDAFLWAFLQGDKFVAHPKPEAWLTKTLINLIRNENRRLSSTEVSLETQYNISAPGDERGIGEILPTKLPKEDQELLIWRFEQRLDYREIAGRLGISESGSRGRVFRAIERCRKLLGNGNPLT